MLSVPRFNSDANNILEQEMNQDRHEDGQKMVLCTLPAEQVSVPFMLPLPVVFPILSVVPINEY